MIRTCLLSGFAVLTLFAGTAAAQEAGGSQITLMGPAAMNPGMALQAPLRPQGLLLGTPASITNRSALADKQNRQAFNQQAIARIRGDAGFAAGFFRGQPLAASRQPPPPPFEPAIIFLQTIEAPFILNNFESAINLDFGEGNVAQQQVAGSGGDVNQQQIATAPDRGANGAPTGNAAAGLDLGLGGGTLPLPPQAALSLEAAARLEKVEINNVNSAINLAVGTGNVAQQQVIGISK
jgi:hypothetical protein